MNTVSDRLTTGWKISGTDTFRRSCSKLLGYYGGNVQNTSVSLLRAIVPPPGYIFLNIDMSGAEALVVAMEAPRGKFRACFDLGIKVHSYMALQLFTQKLTGDDWPLYKSIDPKELAAKPEWKALAKTIKEDEKAYALGKMVIHAKNYSMGYQTFRLNCLERSEGAINLSTQEAKDFLAEHERLFPEILQWQAAIRGEAAFHRNNGDMWTLTNLFGYPKYFGGIWNSALERKLYAFKPQSTVGIITALAITDMSRYIKANKLPWFMLNDKHDSMLVACPNTVEHLEHCKTKCREFMERDLVSSHGEAFKMKSGISVGFNWAKHDKDKNPEGMREL